MSAPADDGLCPVGCGQPTEDVYGGACDDCWGVVEDVTEDMADPVTEGDWDPVEDR